MSTKKTRFIKGIILAPDTVALDNIEGEIKVDSSDGKIKVYLSSTSREIVTDSQSQTLTNKTLTSPVINTGVSGTAISTDSTLAANSDTLLASQKAVKTYVDTAVASKDQASEISYSNATSGLSATNVQDAVDEVDGNVDNLVTLSGVALDSTNLGTFTGTTIPDNQNVKQALQALETSVETKALASDLSTHTSASTNVHGLGIGSSVVGTTDSQSLTNKTIDADLNTITNIENADIKVGANIARAKLASGNANRVVINDALGVQTDAAAITASRALASDANGIPVASATTATELGYVSGVTSAIQTQLGTKVNASGGTLTNGSIVTPSRLDVKQDTFANLQTYAATASNGQLCFATDLKQTYQIVDGVLKAVGGSGGINYIGNPDFESGTTGYATYADAASATPTDGTGGVANITLTASASSPLRGTKSGLITKDVANRQGQGVSYDFTIDSADQAQILRITFDYSSDSGYADDYLRCYVFDVTNSQLIEVIDRTISASSQGKYVGTFQTSSNSTSYRLIFHVADSSSAAWTFKFDNVIVGPQTLIKGAIVTDWQSYTPTFGPGLGTVTTINFWYRRVGSDLEIRGTATTGTVAANSATFTMPSGLLADTSKISSLGLLVGSSIIQGNNTNGLTNYAALVMTAGGLPGTISWSNVANGSNVQNLTTNNGNVIFASSAPFTVQAKIPIAGWSSNQVLSEDSGNRLISMSAYGNAGTSITGGVTDIPFTTTSYDYTSSWNGSQFTAPETGIYDVFGSVQTTVSSTKNIRMCVSGVLGKYVGYTTTAAIAIAGEVYLTKGQTLSIRCDQSATLQNDSNSHHLEITKRSSPQTLAGSETVAASYTVSGQGLSGNTVILYNTKVYDTHNAYNTSTGIFTAPVSGKYLINAQVYRGGSLSTTQSMYIYLYKNLVFTADSVVFGNGQVIGVSPSVSYVADLSKGDTIRINAECSANGTLSSSHQENFMQISRIG